jgi:hypothetical protein
MNTDLPPHAARYSTTAMPKRFVQPAVDDAAGAAGSPSRGLYLSRLGTHRAALDVLKAYKLSGNFQVNLDAVLKDMGLSGKLTYRIVPSPVLAYPDRRHVVFKPNGNVPDEVFDGMINSVKVRIGFEEPWWGRLFRQITGSLTDAWLRSIKARAMTGADKGAGPIHRHS